jgi:Domain of unknown function (DUF4214)
MSRRTSGSSRGSRRPPRRSRPALEALEFRCTPAAFSFSNGAVTNQIGVTSHPASGPTALDEVEAADDFTVARQTEIQGATFTGLIPTGTPLSAIADVVVEVYRVFPNDSDVGRTTGPGTTPPFQTPLVPTRLNSPSDVAFEERDSAAGELSFTPSVLSASFTANNSVIAGINPKPNQKTGGEGARTGQEVQLSVTFGTPIDLPEGHYFFVPQVQLSGSPAFPFLWLSATRPNPALSPDLQSWARRPNIEPDWLRVGTDIVGGSPAPTFNAAFTLAGDVDPNLAFVQALYNDFLGRNGSRAELSGWVSALPALGQAGVANGVIRSAEGLTHAVDGLYVQLLGRGAVGGEEQGWVSLLSAGANEEQVIAGIVSGPEFAAHANALVGGSNPDANFVQALYQLLLNRTGSAEEVNAWLGVLPSLGRAGVGGGFLASAEYRTDVIAPLYTTLLDRAAAPSPAEVSSWVNSGLDILRVELGFASSPEYFANG